MTAPRTATALRILRWTVGLVILLESYRTLRGALSHLHTAGRGGPLLWARLVLSSLEIVGALLFLVPRTLIAGAYMLLAIIALAICIHGLHGEFSGLEILVLYTAAVYVCLAHQAEATRTTA